MGALSKHSKIGANFSNYVAGLLESSLRFNEDLISISILRKLQAILKPSFQIVYFEGTMTHIDV